MNSNARKQSWSSVNEKNAGFDHIPLSAVASRAPALFRELISDINELMMSRQ
jgi:hypothetical protein